MFIILNCQYLYNQVALLQKLIAPSLRFAPGLYRFVFVDKNQARFPLIVDIKKTTDYSLKEAGLLDATIYLVPITSDRFSIDMQAYAKLDIDYTLYNPGMVAIISKTFNLAKDYSGTESFALPSSAPAGNYTHVFSFPDGSKKSFITPKR